MKSLNHDQEMVLYAARRERLNRILDTYGCDAGDLTLQLVGSPPSIAEGLRVRSRRLRTNGAPENLPRIGRWAVVMRSTSTTNDDRFIHCILDCVDIDRVAIASLGLDRWPLCYFDLDQLSGPVLDPQEGDEVLLRKSKRRIYHVVAVESDGEDAVFALARERSGRAVLRRDANALEVVRRSDPLAERRLPLRYDVIRVAADVEFHTKAAAAHP